LGGTTLLTRSIDITYWAMENSWLRWAKSRALGGGKGNIVPARCRGVRIIFRELLHCCTAPKLSYIAAKCVAMRTHPYQ